MAGLASACFKKAEDPAPTYAEYTPIGRQFTVEIDSMFRPTGRGTTSVLRNLQLRFSLDTSVGKPVDIYDFRRF